MIAKPSHMPMIDAPVSNRDRRSLPWLWPTTAHAIPSTAITASGTGNRHAEFQPDPTTHAIALIGKSKVADQSP
jgi:hypothetical protein